jgi:hypothetical protein
MRLFSLILFCIFYQNLPAQNIPVFQVLYAEKASLSNGTPLKSLDKLLDETIHVADSGYLVLIHEMGIPVEFSGDTTIILNEIHSILKPKPKEMGSSYQRSVGADYLFISQEVQAKKYRLSRTGAVHDDRLVHSIYPPLINSRIYFDDDVKIVWQPNFPGIQIEVKLRNLFDEELASYKVDYTVVLISKEGLISEGKNCCILSFARFDDKKQNRRRTNYEYSFLVTKFYTDKINFPYSAKIKTPAAALMAGYFYELASWDVSKEAQAHYELATQLSDKQFYKDMLSNYLKRSGR